MLKKFLIAGFIFVLAGASALSWLSWSEARWQKLRQQYRAEYTAVSTDYLHEYNQWLQLPENLRNKLPWESDDNQANITSEQLRKTQHERFVADLDRLENLETHLYPLARVLYGDDWRQKLRQHNRKDDIEKMFFAGSIICCCTGSALVLTAVVGAGIGRLSKKRNNVVSFETTGYTKTAVVEDIEPFDKVANNDDLTKHLYTDAESIKPQEHKQKALVKLANIVEGKKQKPDDSGETKDSFFGLYRSVTQAKDNIDKSAKKFSKDARAAKKIAQRQPDLLNDTLNRLSEEVAAIRQYAGRQDDRAKKLQQGHDWNIIRNFGLRVIRCVDNLDRRINILSENGHPTEHLEEIRDELLFALESSGLEQYEPQVRSDYRGQEKTAEAVKARQDTDEHDLRGRIADIVRCGYRYVVDDENFKVVRAAQVKLFG